MRYFLVIKSENAANLAAKVINANFIRMRSDWQVSRGFRKDVKTKTGLIDPKIKTDDELKDNYEIQLEGEINGVLNTEYGFSTNWVKAPELREDGQYYIKLPGDKKTRDILLVNCPQPNSIITEGKEDVFPW